MMHHERSLCFGFPLYSSPYINVERNEYSKVNSQKTKLSISISLFRGCPLIEISSSSGEWETKKQANRDLEFGVLTLLLNI